MLNESIFKQYDIRGIYPLQINKKIAFLIGKFLPQIIKSKKIIIARDVRISGGDLIKALICGLYNYNKQITIYNLGITSTPLFYFGTGYLKADSGIMITASHNPKNFNGFKIVSKNVTPISYNSGLEKLKLLIRQNYPKTKMQDLIIKENKPNQTINIDLKVKYIDYLASIIKIHKNNEIFKNMPTFIVDFGNSPVGPIFKILAYKFKLPYIGIFENPNGNFPSRSPDPFKDNLITLKNYIKNQKAIFGCAFDGDGDRIIFLDNQGQKIRPDYIGGIIAKEILNNTPKQKLKTTKIIYDIRSIWHIPAVVKKYKPSQAILWKVGHSLIKEKMRQEKAIFASEFSGHYFFKTFFYSESSLLALLYVLKALVKSKQKNLKTIIHQDIKKLTFHSGEINFITTKKYEILENLKKDYQNSAQKILELDGLTMIFKNWYFNLRLSGTEDLLRLNLEATSKKLMYKKIKELTEKIQKAL